jgi:hypothetical protein
MTILKMDLREIECMDEIWGSHGVGVDIMVFLDVMP